MKRSITASAFLLAVTVATPLSTVAASDATDSSANLRRDPFSEDAEFRRLQTIDFYDPDIDVCKNGDTGTAADYGPCVKSRFPQCEEGKELICYNRTNRRDKFYPDKHPYFFIDYKRVLCYPADWVGWGGCSSCTPGRYCKSEKRCILDEKRYACADWTAAN